MIGTVVAPEMILYDFLRATALYDKYTTGYLKISFY